MKVLITGATGLLGGHLIQELQRRGDQIRALVLPAENAEKLIAQGVEVVRGDVTDASTLAPAVEGIEMLAAYHEKAPSNVYNISNDRPLTQQEIFNAIADDVDGKRPRRHLPYQPIYYGSIVAEKVAFITHSKPIVTRLGAMMFGTDNRHSVEKERRELGYEPEVDIREGIRLAAAWFNAGGMEQPFVIQASQYAPLGGVRKS